MSVQGYTRVCDLGELPRLVSEAAGPRAVERICRDQEVPVAVLDRPDALLLHRDCLGLFRRASDITGQRSFGLRVGAELGIRDLGLFGRYVACAPNLGRALVRSHDTVRFHGTGSRVDCEYAGSRVKFFYRCSEQGNVGWRQQADTVACVLVDVVRCFLGPKWLPLHIEVSYRSNTQHSDLEEHFGVPVLTGKPAVAIVFSRTLLGAAQVCLPSMHPVITRSDVERQGSVLPPDFVRMVTQIVRRRLMVGRTDLEGTAAKLGIGPRTFQRRLNEEGLSYTRLLSDCLQKRAAGLLAESSLSVADIADALGYSSQTHFTRAFKRWAGVPPGEFRNSVCGNGATACLDRS